MTLWRIRDRQTFADLRRRGRRARRGAISVTYLQGTVRGPAQVALTVGRRPAGGAVERNRLRRRLRETMRALAPPLPPGAYVVGATADAAALAHDELRSTLEAAVLAATSGTR